MKRLLSAVLASWTILAGAQEPILRFGVFADAQYDRDTTENRLHRHYALSRDWLSEAIGTFNDCDLAFTVSLGDLIDRSIDCFGDIRPVLQSSRAPILYVYGNHDYPKPYVKAVQQRVFKEIGQDDAYRSAVYGNVRIILLNTNELSTYSYTPGTKNYQLASLTYEMAKKAHRPNAKHYNGSVSKKQLKWLDRELRKAERKGQKAIVMGHAPIAPDSATATEMNAPAIREVLHSHEKTVLAYFSGHEHKGGLEMLGSIPCLTFLGMCEGSQNRYAIVSVYGNGIKVQGFGDQESYDFFKEP